MKGGRGETHFSLSLPTARRHKSKRHSQTGGEEAQKSRVVNLYLPSRLPGQVREGEMIHIPFYIPSSLGEGGGGGGRGGGGGNNDGGSRDG